MVEVGRGHPGVLKSLPGGLSGCAAVGIQQHSKDAWLPLEVPALKKNKSQREPGMYFLNRGRTSTCSSNPASWKQGYICV